MANLMRKRNKQKLENEVVKICAIFRTHPLHVNGPGGPLIQPRVTIHVTFVRFSQCSDEGVLRITSRLA